MPAAPHPTDEGERLAALHGLGVLDTPAEERFDRLTTIAAAALAAPMAAISLVDTDRQWFKSSVGLEDAETPRDVAFCAHAILSDAPLVVDDATEDPRFADNPLVAGPAGIRAYAGVPLESESGHRLGTLCVIDRRRRSFTDEQVALLRQLATWATQELHTLSREHSLDLLRERTEELRVAERAYHRQAAVIAASTDFVGMARPDGRVIDVNPTARRMVGLDGDVDATTLLISDFHPEWAAELILDEALPAAAAHGSWEGETAVLGAAGGEIPVSQVILAHRSEDGGIEFYSTVARDISDRAEIRRLEEIQEIKDQFVATVSHELRTPLTSIHGSLGLLVGGVLGDMPDEAREMVAIAHANSGRLIRLVNDVLDLQKMTLAHPELRLMAVHPRDVVDGAIHAAAGVAMERGIRIRWHMPLPEDTRITCDPDRLTQVVVNLLGNAVKFSPERSEVEIAVTMADPDTLRLEVRDHGPGIDPLDLPHLFEPFWQADSSNTRRTGGTGLGLAVVSSIVEQHGGRIDVDSELGRGTDVRVDLPVDGPDREP
jgi:PAS domain S-box-containing protein